MYIVIKIIICFVQYEMKLQFYQFMWFIFTFILDEIRY